MSQRFNSAWWSVELPSGWMAKAEDQCATLWSPKGAGALQLSSARKEFEDVTDDDLREFALDRIPPEAKLNRATHGVFSGFKAAYQKGDRVWNEWWLRNGQLMMYITFNISRDEERPEQGQIEEILDSLRPKTSS